MVSSGLKSAGYQYVNIDEGWWQGQRDESGNIVVDPRQWPALEPGEKAGDMANIVKFIHGLGLKAGIYTDVGEAGCSFYSPDLGPSFMHTGSEGHYDQDFLQFAQWGFDYIKVDWCGGNKEKLDPATQYGEISRAIQRAEGSTGHALYFSICNWGEGSPWTWAPGLGGVSSDIWRTSDDIVLPIVADTASGTRYASFIKVLSNFDQGIHPEAQHTGFYNDPDMMVVGMRGLSDAQNRVHMSLWAMSAAPLILGADLTKLSTETLRTLTNPEVLSVDQDQLGLQAVKVSEVSPGLQVWSKPLYSPGTRAVLMLNRTAAPASIKVSWMAIGLEASGSATVRDIWSGQELGSYSSGFEGTVPGDDALLLLIKGNDAKPTIYQPISSLDDRTAGTMPVRCNTFQEKGGVDSVDPDSVVAFQVPTIDRTSFVKIYYTNSTSHTIAARLNVDGQIPTVIAFPPGETKGTVGTVAVEIEPKQARPQSCIVVSSPGGSGLEVESIAITRWLP